MAQVIISGDFGGRGEMPTAQILEAQLPASWTIICNKQIATPTGISREIDFIIVASNVIFAVEEKSWRGNIFGNENGWVLRSGESYPSPINTGEMLAKRLAGYLRDQVPQFRLPPGNHFVFSRVVLSSSDARCSVHDPRVPGVVLRLAEAAEELQRFDKLHAGPQSIHAFQKSFIDRLVGLNDKPKVPRAVGSFTVIESLPAQGVVRCLRCKHADGTERVLKLVQPPITLDEARRKAWMEGALREYATLQALAKSGRVPGVDPYFLWDQDRVYVFPIHVVGGKSLRADRTAAPPDAAKVRAVLESAFEALADVHAAGVVHRAITPDRVLVAPEGRVLFNDFALARVEGRETIADVGSEFLPEDFYRAPECRVDLGLAEQASDVFGLALSLTYWASGDEPDVELIPMIRTQPIGWDESLFRLWGDVISASAAQDERSRPNARAVLDQIRKSKGDLVSRNKTGPSHGFATGDLVQDRYRIVRELGSGATATTYLAEDIVADIRVVLKRIRQPELVRRLGLREFQTLRKLRHPNLPEVIDIYPSESPFHLKLEYVRGTSLRDLGNHLQYDVAACLRIAQGILAALGYLAKENLVHRDVSPGNILLPEDEAAPVKLIDFGIAAAGQDHKTLVGTPLYRAPELEHGGAVWSPATDLYSLGVVLFESLTGRLPYSSENDRARKSELTSVTDDEREKCGSRVLSALLRACHPDPLQRFATAALLSDALRDAIANPVILTVDGSLVINPFVDDLRRAYRNSRIGNADNRGLDSAFADSTYVPTRLDTELLPQLCARDVEPPLLTVLSGNPGDGKTAFLQRLRKELTALGGNVVQENAAGWRIELDGRTYASVYDASESHEGQSADQLVDDALAPLAGPERPSLKYTAAIAVNDGRLLAFFEANGPTKYPWLWNQLSRSLFDDDDSSTDVVLIDLKRRSLVGATPEEPSLVRGIIKQFAAPERWLPCEHCVARQDCPIRFIALSLQRQPINDGVADALHRLFLITHLRRDKRATIRDVRSALSFLITGDRGCQDIHAIRASGSSPLSSRDGLYFNAAHNGRGSPDLLLDEWKEIDPAVIPSPRLDRFFWFHRENVHGPTVATVLRSSLERPQIASAAPLGEELDWLVSMKRRYFYEGIATSLARDDSTAFDPRNLTQYRFLDIFVKLLRGDTPDADAVVNLLLGISRSDGVPVDACHETLSLSTADGSDDELCVVKRFPKTLFALRRPTSPDRFIEATPDRIWLVHTPTRISLAIGLDLFELLCRAADGLIPSADEQRVLLEELATFKNHLLAQPTDEVALVEGGRKVHRVNVQDGVIRLMGNT